MPKPPYCYDYPRPAVTTDICLFTVVDDELRILLIKRGAEPFKGSWALPGGFLQETETLDQCAARELQEETGVSTAHLEPFATFSEPDRDPRYRRHHRGLLRPHPGRRIMTCTQVPMPTMPNGTRSGVCRSSPSITGTSSRRDARHSWRNSTGSHWPSALLPPRFTLTQIQKVYEAVEGQPLDKRNFRRSILAQKAGSRKPANWSADGRDPRCCTSARLTRKRLPPVQLLPTSAIGSQLEPLSKGHLFLSSATDRLLMVTSSATRA